MSIDLYKAGYCLWLTVFVCYAGIWMTGSSYEQERKIDGSKNRYGEVQVCHGAATSTFADDSHTICIFSKAVMSVFPQGTKTYSPLCAMKLRY
jgi:hypothetical protein